MALATEVRFIDTCRGVVLARTAVAEAATPRPATRRAEVLRHPQSLPDATSTAPPALP